MFVMYSYKEIYAFAFVICEPLGDIFHHYFLNFSWRSLTSAKKNMSHGMGEDKLAKQNMVGVDMWGSSFLTIVLPLTQTIVAGHDPTTVE